jgi:acetylornithine deacetylase/succinyl-diaminopimelate desuccinylase-like protein
MKNDNPHAIQTALFQDLHTHTEILKEAYSASIVSVDAFQEWVYGKFKNLGIQTVYFRVDPEELNTQPAFRATYQDSFLEESGPKNVLCCLNPSVEEGILFYAHADKHPVTYEYGKACPQLVETTDRFLGAGIADDVSGVAAMVSALTVYLDAGFQPKKQILLASILGKQGGVFGTYGLMRRYGPLGSAVYLHPAESGAGLNELKIASNGLVEFSIRVEGKPPESTEVHQTIFSKSAVSAVEKAIYIHQGLQKWAETQAKHHRHTALETMAGQSFAVTVGRFNSGSESEIFEIPVSCTMQGTLCFPPNARLHQVKEDFTLALNQIAESDPWLSEGHWQLVYGDRIAESAESNPDSEFLKKSAGLVKSHTGRIPRYFYGHSMSDIRYPLLYWQAEAFGIGPLSGDLGKETEWIDRDEYFLTIAILVELMHWFAG